MDITLLRLMRFREKFKAILPSLPRAALDPKTLFILGEFHSFFKQFPDAEVITADTWHTFFNTFRHKDLGAEERATYRAIMNNAFEDVPEAIEAGIMRRVHELAFATRLANIADDYNNGKEICIKSVVQSEFDSFKLNVTSTEDVSASWVRADIGELLSEEERDDGIKFRLSCLNWTMRPMRPGDFGIVAGRPDRGKTTFLASECTYWAKQLPADRPVVWLNNEGPGKRIIPRLYQAALGLTIPQLIEQNAKGTLIPAYAEAIGGLDKIRIIDIHGMNTAQVDSILDFHNPGLILCDMIDHVKMQTGEQREDRKLEELYKHFREQAVIRECIIIATSQISADGDGLLFPSQHMLKDSKTGKQGACDFMIMLGASNDPNMGGIRGIGLEKNKLSRAGRPNNPRAEVAYRPDIARYMDDGLPDG